MKLTLKYLFMGALLTTTAANAGPIDAAVYAGNEVKVGVAHVTDFAKGIVSNTGGIVAFYDNTKNRFSVIASGNYAVNAYKAIVLTPTDAAKTYVGMKENLDGKLIVLAGQTVDWAVRVALGIPVTAIREVPYVGTFAADLSGVFQKFTTSVTKFATNTGTHLVTGTYGIVNDTLNLAEEILTLDRPFYNSGKYVVELPGKVVRLLGIDYGVKNTVTVGKAVVSGVKAGANAVAKAAAAPAPKKKRPFAKGPRS